MRAFNQNSYAFFEMLAILAIGLSSIMLGGCCVHRPQPQPTCPPYVSQRGPLAATLKPAGATVETDFTMIETHDTVKQNSLGERAAGGSMALDLQEVQSAAARNSRLADLIDAERHALDCRTDQCGECGEGGSPILQQLLAAEALEQRGAAAGAAAKLFLKLVEVELQQELWRGSELHFNDLANTIGDAAGEGFAMADEENEIAAARLQLKTSLVKLNSSRQLLNAQLGELIFVDTERLTTIKPVYKLQPSLVRLDPQSEISTSEINRPGIVALEWVLVEGIPPDALLNLLTQFDARLGVKASRALNVLKHRSCLVALFQRWQPPKPSEPDTRTRGQQLQQILDAEKSKVRLEVRSALVKIQGAFETLAIANENVQRLEEMQEQLAGQAELDAREAFAATNQNWQQIQTAQSARITAAIEYDSAMIELLQAQGLLISPNGCDQLQ